MLPKKEIYRQVAYLHIEALDQGFLARLGPRFLALLYEKIDQTPGYHLITHEEGGRVFGFVSGGPGMGRIYRALLSSWHRLIISLVPSMLSPKNVLGVFELLRHKAQDESAPLPTHELLSIAVAAKHRGSGVADALFRELSTRFSEAGVDQFKIVVGDKLEPAQKFYLKMQAEPKAKTQVHKGASSTIFVAHVKVPEGQKHGEPRI